MDARTTSRMRLPGSLPITSYFSVVGVHTTLLSFTALFLPRTDFLVDFVSRWDSISLTSQDRPQHPFLTPLTKSPVATLLSICFGTLILQAWWASCLKNWWYDSVVVEGSDDERKLERSLLSQQQFRDLRNACITTFAASIIFHILFILFGAPVTSHVVRTYLLSLLVANLSIFPPAYILGIPIFTDKSASMVKRFTWVRLFAEFSARNSLERALCYPAIGTALGCWVGVIPVALDWDRPWQTWPLTPAFGAIAGHILASICALTVSATKDLSEEHARNQDDPKPKSN